MVKLYFSEDNWKEYKKLFIPSLKDIKGEMGDINIGKIITFSIIIPFILISIPFMWTNCLRIKF